MGLISRLGAHGEGVSRHPGILGGGPGCSVVAVQTGCKTDPSMYQDLPLPLQDATPTILPFLDPVLVICVSVGLTLQA